MNRLRTPLVIETVLITVAILAGPTLMHIVGIPKIGGGETGLPHEPYPYTSLPIESKFNEGKLEPLKLLAAFDSPGSGKVSFENSCLKYESSSWSWLVTRTELQDSVNVKWIWKAVEGEEFIIEAWNAHSNNVGHTAMIVFKDGKVCQIRYPDEVYLMDFSPFDDFVTVRMIIDYNVPKITDLWINEYHFTHLPIEDEPIGTTSPFWQMQIFLQKRSIVLVKEMQAWK